ncbi:hypothetical protein [Limosilactobacillus equigenerosi]|uniref:DUF308 domain-containing protein n=1 Tax=Limosilactobacillus equigenerosi DSM 18793 = JCM 14505 TaxID=1423742 RepID=A0A0R1UPP9_9LACO|nr:hypothetical protein [Limosilactobacillus equigenerosi]KRL94788.1 hypothetical protein FC21_GL001254 [Limosilactobacillus equigenerosi DSM 18793 = JCM 14505]
MLVLAVMAGLVFILACFYLVNSIQQYGQWKFATFLVLVSLAGTVWGVMGVIQTQRHRAAVAENAAATQSSLVGNGVLSSQNTANKGTQEKYILGQLQKSFEKMGSVSYREKDQTFVITPTDDQMKEALTAMQNDHSIAEQIGWDNLTKNLTQSSASIKKALGSGYSLELASPNDAQQALFTAKDGKATYNVIK